MAKSTAEFVLRPFQGLPGEADWVSMREIVPSATAPARMTAEHGGEDVVVATVLPGGWAAMRREDGTVLLGVQGVLNSDDLSRDLAAALLAAVEGEPGTGVLPEHLQVAADGPRLQDVLDDSVPFEVTVHEGYDYWIDSSAEMTDEIRAGLDEAAAQSVPTVKLDGVDAAYWCRMSREFVRWARTEDEDRVVDAIARLHAKRDSGLAGGKFLGMFRACGLVVPVWELPRGTEADELTEPVQDLSRRLEEALAVEEPLDATQRRARAGIVSRQVTLR
ncbi:MULTISPECIES: DUF5926 family protein [unclassified Isoptericola]|uniref:DUF5926 family protein n=1 Tax=unclassified Isoptericola TaxID=2623355 RepID=UPI002712FE7F|nr:MULTISPECIES: DUF5926 family protein [unclassified Isoptericola]MDO8145743.1 DUF5926 family protein [Isoptericola sp. 178]MDO8147916.1 DUF5926 family protein [Isoptericola sp. b515]